MRGEGRVLGRGESVGEDSGRSGDRSLRGSVEEQTRSPGESQPDKDPEGLVTLRTIEESCNKLKLHKE